MWRNGDAKCIKMHRFACYNSIFFRWEYAPESPYWEGLYGAPIPHPLGTPALSASRASLGASIVRSQCLLAVDLTPLDARHEDVR